MVRTEERKIVLRLFAFCEVSLPLDDVRLILLIKHFPCMHIVFHYDFPSTVLQKLFPCGIYLFALLRRLVWCNVAEIARSHVHIEQAKCSKYG
jgi:hypothetical protein